VDEIKLTPKDAMKVVRAGIMIQQVLDCLPPSFVKDMRVAQGRRGASVKWQRYYRHQETEAGTT